MQEQCIFNIYIIYMSFIICRINILQTTRHLFQNSNISTLMDLQRTVTNKKYKKVYTTRIIIGLKTTTNLLKKKDENAIK